MYFIEVRHDALGKYILIKGTDRRVVEQKAAAQSLQWNELWRRKLQKEKNRSEKERMLFNVQNKKEEAKRRSIENEDEFKNLNNVLLQTIKFNDAINWDSLKDHSQFFESKPHEVSLKILPIKPDEADFTPQFGLMESIFIFARRKKSHLLVNCIMRPLPIGRKTATKLKRIIKKFVIQIIWLFENGSNDSVPLMKIKRQKIYRLKHLDSVI